jgi:hypothetical protein
MFYSTQLNYSPLPQKTNGKPRAGDKRGRSPSEDTTSSPTRDLPTFHINAEPSQAGPSRHVSFSSMTSRPAQVSQPLGLVNPQAGPSRPTSGPLMVESILEEEALARKGR